MRGSDVVFGVLHERDEAVLRQAASLHYRALSYRSFITSFGPRFMMELYRVVLQSRAAFLVTAHSGDLLQGFILATTDDSGIMGSVLRHWPRFLPLVLGRILLDPSLLKKTVETFFYRRREGDLASISAELVVIAVREDMRSRGLGAELVQHMETAFEQQGVERYKVTVHAAMERSNQFYRRLEMTLASSFEMFGVPWNLYVQRLPRAWPSVKARASP